MRRSETAGEPEGEMLMAIDGVGMRFTRYSGSPAFTFLKVTLTLALFGGILGAIGSVQSRPKLDVKVSEMGLGLSGENVDFLRNPPKISGEGVLLQKQPNFIAQERLILGRILRDDLFHLHDGSQDWRMSILRDIQH